MRQCSSCGGYCKKSGCERANLPRYTIGPYKVDYADFQKALELACYYQNRCCDLEEIIEMFCMDAAEANKVGTPPLTRVLITPYYEIDGAIT